MAIAPLPLPSLRCLLLGLWFGSGFVANLHAQSTSPATANPTLAQRFARTVSPQVRQLQAEHEDVQQRLSRLPKLDLQYNLRAGFHSRYAKSATDAQWVQIDLGAPLPIELIALIPACVQVEDQRMPTFGFPEEFRIEGANDFEATDAQLIYDSKQRTFAERSGYPLLIPTKSVTARYVRITCTKLASYDGNWFFALSELLVLGGNRNLASWRPVASSGAIETDLRWSATYLVDAISALPSPTGLTVSPTDGYLSAAHVKVDDPAWIEIDLGQSYPVDEVRLYPARPQNQPDSPGWGFPSSFILELRRSADDEEPIILYDCSQAELRHWLHSPLIVPVGSRRSFQPGASLLHATNPRTELPVEPVAARFVRLRVQRHDTRNQPFFLALAEVQAYAGGKNVAAGKPATANSVASADLGKRWGLPFVNDGFDSRRELLELPHWLSLIDERRNLELRSRAIQREVTMASESIWQRFLWGSGSLLAVVLSSAAIYNFRLRLAHRQQTAKLRRQLASDLHDDIGSNLGTIALLCESLGPDTLSSEQRDTVREIREIAIETGDAMRDIIWIMGPRETSLQDFVVRLRHVAGRLLPHHDFELECASPLPARSVSLVWRRNVFLALKELLHNVAKHASAKSVHMNLHVERKFLVIELRDDGCGFGESPKRGGGLGMQSVQRRLEELGGSLTVQSPPGTSAAFELRVPLT